MKPAPKLKSEPVSEKLVRTLIHPVRTASISVLKFSPDGKQLLVGGYPSGVLQLWDTGTWEERRRIETPPGYRGSADYAELTADWKTVVVPVENRKVVRGEKDGKQTVHVEMSGEVRSWDLTTGKPRPPLKLAGRDPIYAFISPDGTKLLTLERKSYDANGRSRPADVAVLHDTAAGTSRELATGFGMAAFSPNSRRFVVANGSRNSEPARLRLFDTATPGEPATLAQEKDANIHWPTFSPDGRYVAAEVRFAEGGGVRVWDVAARTLAAEFKPLTPVPVLYPEFVNGSKLVAGCDTKGNAYVWDVAAKKAAFTYKAGEAGEARKVVVSPDGKRAAVALWPPIKRDEIARDPDPADLPQPWVELYDLASGEKTETLFCPHGVAWQLAFSPDGNVLAVGGSGAVHLFDVK